MACTITRLVARSLLLASLVTTTGCVVYPPPSERVESARPAAASHEPAVSDSDRRQTFDPPADERRPPDVSWPVQGTIISGYRASRGARAHEGIDIRAPRGTGVHSVAAGLVVQSGWMNGYGNLVTLDHGDGLETRYAHLSEIFVRVGERVEPGERVAAVGATGNATTPHLHFEVRQGGRPMDPIAWLPPAPSYPAALE